MKTKTYLILILFLVLFLPLSLLAQVPQGIPYQAMIRGNDGAALVNANVTVRFTLHQNTTTGPVEYQETQALTTNAYGLINTQFGTGTPTQGTFAGIVWSNTSKFIQVEANDGTGYVDMGTQQMMSVPYAMYAGSAGNTSLPQGIEPGCMLVWNGSNWENIAPPTSSHASLNWCEGEIKWGDCNPSFANWSIVIDYVGQARIVMNYCPYTLLGFGVIQSNNSNFDSFTELPSGRSFSPSNTNTYLQGTIINYAVECYFKAYVITSEGDTTWSETFYSSFNPNLENCLQQNACNYNPLSYGNYDCIFPGNDCDDLDAATLNDIYNDECQCIGQNPNFGEYLLPDVISCVNEQISISSCENQNSIIFHEHSYSLIEISGQCWFSENLQTSKYTNGDNILSFNGDYQVMSTSTDGMYIDYNFDAQLSQIYGKLYNWYVVSDSRGICPTGWHIPTDCEWMYLEQSLGMSSDEIELFGSRNLFSDTNNINPQFSGWGGPESMTISFGSIDEAGYYWQSGQTNENNSIYRSFVNGYNVIGRNEGEHHFALSLRCIKN